MLNTFTGEFERCQCLDGSVGYFWPGVSILVEEKHDNGKLVINPLMGDKTDQDGIRDLTTNEMLHYVQPIAELLGGGSF